jgi:hypothetical protein
VPVGVGVGQAAYVEHGGGHRRALTGRVSGMVPV